jgi:hypothetical protein
VRPAELAHLPATTTMMMMTTSRGWIELEQCVNVQSSMVVVLMKWTTTEMA